jgi:gas vesicle protein
MTNEESPRSGALALFFTFLGGALVGGAAALLLAPRSGAETRRRIAGAADGAKETASRLPQALREASGAAQAAFAKSLRDASAADPAAARDRA